MRKKLSIAFATATLTTIVAPFGASPAHAETYHDEIEFSRTHECTHEEVIGDVRIHVTTTTTDNGDGTTSVHVVQHYHGSHLIGTFSGDEYVLNERTEEHLTFVVVTNLGGVGTAKTTVNPQGEGQAFPQGPGQDGPWRRVSFVVPPGGGPRTTLMGDMRCH